VVPSGIADVVFHEAIMLPEWQRATTERETCFVPMEPEALALLESELGWPSATLPPKYLPDLDFELRTLDFSDFLVLVHEDMPDDVASFRTWCMNETSEAIERQYRHLPADRTPVGYPLDPRQLRQTPIPLHPAAERYYADRVESEEAEP
jgi:TRAP-type uncharacterized transport system substrate-binding protein